MNKTMNILYYFKDYKGYMSQWQHTHIFDELERNGHQITVYNPLSYRNPDDANENLIPYIHKSKIKFDLFLNCESDGFLYPSSVKALHKLGLATVLICFDNLHAPYIHKKIAPLFDLVWITSIETKWLFENSKLTLQIRSTLFRIGKHLYNRFVSLGLLMEAELTF